MYNSEKYIRECLYSISSQNYQNLEIIVVDDGSIDDSSKIIEELSVKDNRIKYFFQKNSGAPHARNYGLKMAKGQYIIFFDADDIMNELAISKLVLAMADQNFDFVVGKYIYLKDNGEYVLNENQEYLFKEAALSKDKLLIAPYIDPIPNTKIFNSDFLKNNALEFKNLKIGQDLNFYLNVLNLNPKIGFLESYVCNYRIHPNSISSTYGSNLLDIITSLKDIQNKDNTFFSSNERIYNTVRMNHTMYQFYKLPKIDNKKTRILIYDQLLESITDIREIDKQHINVGIFKRFLILNLKQFYNSNFFSNILKLRGTIAQMIRGKI